MPHSGGSWRDHLSHNQMKSLYRKYVQENASSHELAEFCEEQFGVDVSHAAVRAWIQEYDLESKATEIKENGSLGVDVDFVFAEEPKTVLGSLNRQYQELKDSE